MGSGILAIALIAERRTLVGQEGSTLTVSHLIKRVIGTIGTLLGGQIDVFGSASVGKFDL